MGDDAPRKSLTLPKRGKFFFSSGSPTFLRDAAADRRFRVIDVKGAR